MTTIYQDFEAATLGTQTTGNQGDPEGSFAIPTKSAGGLVTHVVNPTLPNLFSGSAFPSGARCVRCQAPATSDYAYDLWRTSDNFGVASIGQGAFSIEAVIPAAPASGIRATTLVFYSLAGAPICTMLIRDTGRVDVYNRSGSPAGTGSSPSHVFTFPASLMFDFAADPDTATTGKVKLDIYDYSVSTTVPAVSIAEIANADLGTSPIASVRAGKHNGSEATAWDIYFDRPRISDVYALQGPVSAPGTVWAVSVTDSAGSTDTSTEVSSKVLTATDSAGSTDSPTSYSASPLAVDSAGVTDSSTRTIGKGVTDSAGSSDSVAFDFSSGTNPIVNRTDSAGSTDTSIVGLSKPLTFTDSAGSTDTSQVAKVINVTDSAGSTDSASRQFTVGGQVYALVFTDDAGSSDIGISPSFPSTETLVRLMWLGAMDDHQRSRQGLWKRFGTPYTQTALLLWRDGTVEVSTDLSSARAMSAEYIAAGGHETVFPLGSWQAQVLLNAGYTLEQVEVAM